MAFTGQLACQTASRGHRCEVQRREWHNDTTQAVTTEYNAPQMRPLVSGTCYGSKSRATPRARRRCHTGRGGQNVQASEMGERKESIDTVQKTGSMHRHTQTRDLSDSCETSRRERFGQRATAIVYGGLVCSHLDRYVSSLLEYVKEVDVTS